jgi:2-hydroxychromene-2-carboxylate isomerase
MAAPPVLYYDFNSPYAWLAAERIGDMIPDAEWRPFAFPFLLHERGRLEEAMARDPAATLEIVRPRAAERGLPPVEPPPGWPNETWSLGPLRAAVFADDQGRLREFTVAAFRAFFIDGRTLAEPGNLRDAAAAAGLGPDEVEEAIQRPEIKQRVKGNTEEAIARGVTGIPTVAVGDDLYWGDDRLEEAAAAARS